MTTKDEVRSTVEALKLALEALEETRNALAWFYDSYPQDVTKKGNELLPHVETVLTTIREALASQSEALNAPLADTALERMAENERELGLDYIKPAEIPQSIICPFCESQHVPGWLHDYNMDRMKKPAHVAPPYKQQSASVSVERVEPALASVVPHCYMDEYGNVRGSYEYWMECEGGWFPVYTSPPASPSQGDIKPWVGLTQEQRASIAEANNMLVDDDLFDAIEAKLKEKNELREKNA